MRLIEAWTQYNLHFPNITQKWYKIKRTSCKFQTTMCSFDIKNKTKNNKLPKLLFSYRFSHQIHLTLSHTHTRSLLVRLTRYIFHICTSVYTVYIAGDIYFILFLFHIVRVIPLGTANTFFQCGLSIPHVMDTIILFYSVHSRCLPPTSYDTVRWN